MGLPDPAATTGQMRERRRSDYPVLRTTPLRWADVDTYGHVNNAVHYLLMDTAINGWLGEAVGVDIRSELSGFAVVAETGCRYLREIHFPATPELGIRLRERVAQVSGTKSASSPTTRGPSRWRGSCTCTSITSHGGPPAFPRKSGERSARCERPRDVRPPHLG